jgi:class 3 adenylate cyclase
VVFLDVVEFTKHHMQAQLAIKTHLDARIRELLDQHSRDDYILLDRGDGAAVCFLLDPETALYFALNLRDAVRAQEDSSVPYNIRTGINLGPIKIVLDVNGDKTTLGEGINCAARIMDFAGAGQIYVSRSFYEVVGCLSQEYAELFSYLGKRADKHVREFEVYEVAAARARPESPAAIQAGADTARHGRDWDAETLQSRITRLSEEIGPMARILVHRAAQKADTLEDLDRLLDAPDIQVMPAQPNSLAADTGFDPSFLAKAERLLGQHLGPIAAVLVKRAAARASDHAGLARLLAAELADEQEKQAFLSGFEIEP